MRRLILPLAALALVSACKKEAAPAADASEAAAAATTAAAVAMPALTTNARAGTAYAGTYTQTAATGTTKLTLAADGTFEWTGADGKAVKGKFSWYKDGSTILLDAAGGKAVYALADGGIYKLASNDAPRTGFTADQLWTKAAM
jgi:hypothetical protein